MGCATSKQKVCRNCQAPYSPVRRSYSLHAQTYHKDDDSHHKVALTSSTLGSLRLEPSNVHEDPTAIRSDENGTVKKRTNSKEDFAVGLIEAKSWSQMISEKIPKKVPITPVMTPPGEPETINAWELMEGLEDTSPLVKPPHHLRSFSFHVSSNPIPSIFDNYPPKSRAKSQENGEESPKPLWLESTDDDSNSNSNDTSIVSEFDPEVISTFRKALEDLPPANPFYLKPIVFEKQVQALADKDQASLEVTALNHDDLTASKSETPRGKDKVVVYFTSLRGVRKTYEECCHVRVILKGLGVKADERDVSMHSGFKEELKELLGDGYNTNGGGLPRVFVGKKYIGGAEEIRRMHEEGKLGKEVEGCERAEDGSGGILSGGVCEGCGDIRFVPCETCSGSCKIYYEADYEEEECEEDEYGFQRCPDCNENGLIRCPICCD